jgi:putative spermidine/putrescine transport system permease protein
VTRALFLIDWRWRGLQVLAWLVLAFLFLPLLIVIPVSLSDQPYLSLPRSALSLQHYARVAGSAAWMQAIGQTAIVAALVAVFSTVVGAMAAIACWSASNRWTLALQTLALTPLIVPPVVSGLGFYQLWAKLNLLDSYTGVLLAFTIKTLPYTFTTISASLALLDIRITQAARNLGANQATAIATVLVPAALPGLLSAMLFAFVYVWDEVVILLFISSRKVRLLPRLIWEGLQDTVDPAIAVIATGLIVLTGLAILAVALLQREAERS